jgi:hypothetical protein
MKGFDLEVLTKERCKGCPIAVSLPRTSLAMAIEQDLTRPRNKRPVLPKFFDRGKLANFSHRIGPILALRYSFVLPEHPRRVERVSFIASSSHFNISS